MRTDDHKAPWLEPAADALPLLTFIIPTFNAVTRLEICLDLLFKEIEQNYPNAEVIVIDGGSKDGTVEILKRYESRLAYWISERDTGVADAVNKGIAKAKGEVIYFGGDDDELMPGAAARMVRHLMDHPDLDAVIGNGVVTLTQADGSKIPWGKPVPPGRLTLPWMLRVELGAWPTMEMQFSRRRLFEKYGKFDPRFNYEASLEVWCRHVKAGANIEQVADVVLWKNYVQTSGTVRARHLWVKELDDVLRLYGGTPFMLKMKVRRYLVSSRWVWSARTGFRYVWFGVLHATRPLRRALGLDESWGERVKGRIRSALRFQGGVQTPRETPPRRAN